MIRYKTSWGCHIIHDWPQVSHENGVVIGNQLVYLQKKMVVNDTTK